nr:SMI1/KNR4 family protein [Lentibacillus daqui]
MPDDYKQFLRWYGETFFEKNIIFKPLEPPPTATEDGNQYFDGFYGLMSENNINQQIDDYKNRIPGNLIPVGECPGGNLICIGVNGTSYGKIYFWNHENELEARLMIGDVAGVENIDLYWDNIYLVSETFVDFLNTLEIDNNDFEEDENMDEIELWLDDDLLDD